MNPPESTSSAEMTSPILIDQTRLFSVLTALKAEFDKISRVMSSHHGGDEGMYILTEIHRLFLYWQKELNAAALLSPKDLANFTSELSEAIAMAAHAARAFGQPFPGTSLNVWLASTEALHKDHRLDREIVSQQLRRNMILETAMEVVRRGIPGFLEPQKTKGRFLLQHIERIDSHTLAFCPVRNALNRASMTTAELRKFLSQITECADDFAEGNLRTYLAMIDFDHHDFMALCTLATGPQRRLAEDEYPEVESLFSCHCLGLQFLKEQSVDELQNLCAINVSAALTLLG